LSGGVVVTPWRSVPECPNARVSHSDLALLGLQRPDLDEVRAAIDDLCRRVASGVLWVPGHASHDAVELTLAHPSLPAGECQRGVADLHFSFTPGQDHAVNGNISEARKGKDERPKTLVDDGVGRGLKEAVDICVLLRWD
jgi:hypothetical protein